MEDNKANPSLPKKKLALVLDLDHTLLHAKLIADLSPNEKYLLTSRPNTVFTWDNRLLKLRPSAQSFIKEASKLFHIYIYTMGNRSYALGAVRFLDPKQAYIHPNNVSSEEDCTISGRKGLDVVKHDERFVVVVDDSEVVWEDHRDNQIKIEKYNYFSSSFKSRTIKSFSESKADEDGDVLVGVLDLVRRIRRMFFDYPDFSDVRVVMREMRQEILKGCRIVFSLYILHVTNKNGKPLSEMVEEMGGIWSGMYGATANATTTHVVSWTVRSKAALWAVKKRKFLVSPRWIQAAYYSYSRPEEESFILYHPSNVD